MKTKIQRFKDPEGKFIISIPSNWKYNENGESVKRGLHQFEISNEFIFQISCRKINDRILNIIESNKIMYHDFNLLNFGFHEVYQVGEFELCGSVN